MPKKPLHRRMFANRDFFAKPAGVAKLVSASDALVHFKTPVIVTAVPEKLGNVDLCLAVALGNYRERYNDVALKDFLRGYLGCVLY